jgi:hypothetical protein
MENLKFIIEVAVFLGGLIVAFWFGFVCGIIGKDDEEYKANQCDCDDVNQCTKWCVAKDRFTEDFNNGKI